MIIIRAIKCEFGRVSDYIMIQETRFIHILLIKNFIYIGLKSFVREHSIQNKEKVLVIWKIIQGFVNFQ
jgi:hypothetical protein